MEVRSLSSESRQYAMSSCWMNKGKHAPLCLVWVYTIYWLTSNAIVWEKWLYLFFLRNMNLSTSFVPLNEKKLPFYQWESLWKNTALKRACSMPWMTMHWRISWTSERVLYTEVLMPKSVRILWGEKMNEFVKCFIAWQASDLPQHKERLKLLSKADVSLFVWPTDLF